LRGRIAATEQKTVQAGIRQGEQSHEIVMALTRQKYYARSTGAHRGGKPAAQLITSGIVMDFQ
jgi:hypothetical protein